MRDDLVDAVRDCRARDDVRAVLVSATGDSFCSGMDLRGSTVAQAGTDDFDPRSTSQALRIGVQTFIRELWELDKPTVAAVHGAAVGPGAHLALACDFVFTCDTTKFLWSFARWGLVVDAGGAYLLPRLVGLPRAKAMVMLGEGAVGTEAVDLGLAYRHVGMADEMALGADPFARPVEATAEPQLRDGPGRQPGAGRPLPGPGHRIVGPGGGDGGVQGEAAARLHRPLNATSPNLGDSIRSAIEFPQVQHASLRGGSIRLLLDRQCVLGAGGDGDARRVLVGRRFGHDDLAVAQVVGLEHLGSQGVAPAVARAGIDVQDDLHAADLRPAPRGRRS
jgi:2-(1,2-epoxy-1,2-dihydrophenyl)acetyl-CoA isomerase